MGRSCSVGDEEEFSTAGAEGRLARRGALRAPRRGALRAQIEAVRVRKDYRNQGLGAAMFLWAIGEARRRGCALVQLTTDKSRVDAHRFYERLGFTDSHEGLKLKP